MISQKKPTTDNKKNSLLQKVEELEQLLKKAQTELESAENTKLRALADLQNFQRRQAEMQAKWGQMAVAEFLKSLIPTLKELVLAHEHCADNDIKKVLEKFLQSFDGAGLQMVNPGAGDEFSPEIHEAVTTEKGAENTVVKTLEVGWKFQDTLLATAKVSVGSGGMVR